MDIRGIPDSVLSKIVSHTVFELTDDDIVKEIYLLIEEEKKIDYFIFLLNELKNSDNILKEVETTIESSNDIIEELGLGLMIDQCNVSDVKKLLIYLRNLAFKRAYEIS